jgi:hypothetical protein
VPALAIAGRCCTRSPYLLISLLILAHDVLYYKSTGKLEQMFK